MSSQGDMSALSIPLVEEQKKTGDNELIEEDDYRAGRLRTKTEYTAGCCGQTPLPARHVAPFLERDEKVEPRQVKSIFVILNPHSGNNRAAKVWEKVKPVFDEAGVKYEFLYTEYARHATKLANETNFDGHDALVVIGGDGTIHETLNGLLSRADGKKIPLGLLAGGTGNSVLVTMGATDPVRAAKAIVKGHVVNLDVGKCSWADRSVYAINMVGWGLPADANATAESCRCCGPMRYNFGGLWQILLAKQRDCVIEVDGVALKDKFCFAMVCNNQHAGSELRFAPHAKLNDGLLDLLLWKRASRCTVLSAFGHLQKCTHHSLEIASFYRFKKVVFNTTTQDVVSIDGENCAHTPMTIEVCPGVLPVYYDPTTGIH